MTFPKTSPPVLDLDQISLIREPKTILDQITLKVHKGQRWAILGRNGCGKSTLLAIAALRQHPSAGSVSISGEHLGKVDVRTLRQKIGYMSANLASQLRRRITAADIVVTAKHDALEPWWNKYDARDYRRADELLAEQGCADMAQRSFISLSSGERQRVLLARSLFNEPSLILLDEPAAALDIAGREQLVKRLQYMGDRRPELPMVLVTHHLEEIPINFTHMMLMKQGRSVAAGPLNEVLSEENLSATFGMELKLIRAHNRLMAISPD